MFTLLKRQREIAEDTGVPPIDCRMLDIEDWRRIRHREMLGGQRQTYLEYQRNANLLADRTADRFAGATRLFEACTCQCVHPLVLRMTVMAPHPVPFELVA